jgi:glycosyltransferase involved in cell wall biosynthesis
VGLTPAIAVVVATRDRPVRLRWLLNALDEQDTSDFEVVVAHNSSGPETGALLAERGVRHVELPAGPGPAALRNAAWRASAAPLILFTDDDCRPPGDWVRNALAAAARHPGAMVQGQTQPDPDELGILHHAPYARSQEIVPPHVMAQTCNILYPRAVLERVGGFDESFPQAVGEDTDLALRARAAGVAYAGAAEVLTYHGVDRGLVSRLRGTWRWQHMALLVGRHPELRRELPLGGWAWKAEHARLLLAVAGMVLRRPWLALPYVLSTPRTYGSHPRALARTAIELPGRVVIDMVETAALIRGSVRHRAPLL